MRKALGIILLVLAVATPAHALTQKQKDQCLFNSMQAGEWTTKEMQRTAWCVVEKWSVPGGHGKVEAVGDCESHWNRFAYNDSGPYVGLFQHALSSWRGRVRTYEPRWWDLKPGWGNARTQIVVTVRMVRAQGWGPWSCA